ncbi:hypothetical protein F5884DRAFT_294839 [Xylogone sp. PMI_703]|nr:hypothetical protein F5884DRAFT_294839 [Xylogone sp. PMI_703]
MNDIQLSTKRHARCYDSHDVIEGATTDDHDNIRVRRYRYHIRTVFEWPIGLHCMREPGSIALRFGIWDLGMVFAIRRFTVALLSCFGFSPPLLFSYYGCISKDDTWCLGGFLFFLLDISFCVLVSSPFLFSILSKDVDLGFTFAYSMGTCPLDDFFLFFLCIYRS